MTKANKTTTNATTHATTKPKHGRKRRWLGRDETPATAPELEYVTEEGKEAVKVLLSGRPGKGRFMLLDRSDWEQVSKYTDRWCLASPVTAAVFVSSGRKSTIRLANILGLELPPKGRPNNVMLARLLKLPRLDQKVTHLNGNPLDLRRSNLAILETDDRINLHQTARAFEKNLMAGSDTGGANVAT